MSTARFQILTRAMANIISSLWRRQSKYHSLSKIGILLHQDNTDVILATLILYEKFLHVIACVLPSKNDEVG